MILSDKLEAKVTAYRPRACLRIDAIVHSQRSAVVSVRNFGIETGILCKGNQVVGCHKQTKPLNANPLCNCSWKRVA